MKKLFIAFLILTLSSCASQTFLVNPAIKREVPVGSPHFSKWSHFFVGGIGQTDFRNAADLCKENGGVGFVEAKQSFAQGFVTVVTYGIYSPRTVNIYCNKQ